MNQKIHYPKLCSKVYNDCCYNFRIFIIKHSIIQSSKYWIPWLCCFQFVILGVGMTIYLTTSLSKCNICRAWRIENLGTFFRVHQYRFAYMLCTQPISCMWITCACTHVCRSCMPPCMWLCTLSKYFPRVVLPYLILH